MGVDQGRDDGVTAQVNVLCTFGDTDIAASTDLSQASVFNYEGRIFNGVTTIANDDSAVLSIESASSTTEGTPGELVVTLSNPVDNNVTYTFSTVDGSATF